MAQVCSSCTYYDAEGDRQQCPNCGETMQFTTLGAPGEQIDEEDAEEQAWSGQQDVSIETLEQPLGVRLGQIGAGIAFFFIVRRIGETILTVCFSDLLFQEDAKLAFMTMALISLVMYVVAALVAGAIAGAWSVNWIPQGIGVGAGLFAIPFILLAIFVPKSLVLYVIVVLVTTPVTILGAYLGHVLMKPARFIHS